MLNKILLKNSRGDTIIEVFLSVAVLSLVLTISYGLATRNSNYVRAAQERGEALKFTQAQLEVLKKYDNKDTWAVDSYRCFKADNTPTTTASECSFGDDSRYRLQITQNTNTYTVATIWDSATGNGSDNISISYRLY